MLAMGTPVKSYLSSDVNLHNLLTILEGATTLGMVSAFLKSKNLPSSAGSWVDMKNKRILPALEEGKIFVGELVELLRAVEETGHQHVLLFSMPPENLNPLFDQTIFQQKLIELGLSKLVTEPQFLLLPEEETLVDIRFGATSGVAHLVLKEYATKQVLVKSGEYVSEGQLVKTWTYEDSRSVNLVRIWQHGLIEVRIESRASKCDYSELAFRFLKRLPSMSLNNWTGT